MLKKETLINKDFLASLTDSPGIYQMLGESGQVLYIGKARNLKKRISSYFHQKMLHQRLINLIRQIKNITVIVTQNENEALLLENQLIKQYQPKYNVLLRDDKSYPYIILSHHDYPQLTSRRGKGTGKIKKDQYFGPYPSVFAVRDTVKLIQNIFKLRTCRDSFFKNRTKPCLLYQLNKCSAPCVGYISKQDYQKDIDNAELLLHKKNKIIVEYLETAMHKAAQEQQYELARKFRDQITSLKLIQLPQAVTNQKGNVDIVIIIPNTRALEILSIREGCLMNHQTFYPKVPANIEDSELLVSFMGQYYNNKNIINNKNIKIIINIKLSLSDKKWLEQAFGFKIKTALRGEPLQWIKMAEETGQQAVRSKLIAESRYHARVEALRTLFKLPRFPQRLECFDISHHGGTAIVASCVVFDDKGPVKKEYRKFNIVNITPGDDYAAMRQVILRRYKKATEKTLPDIIFIDGGKGQLRQAEEVLAELKLATAAFLVAVSKGPDRRPGEEQLWLSGRQDPIIIPSDSEALHLIQYIRNESHRFAVSAHRQKKRMQAKEQR